MPTLTDQRSEYRTSPPPHQETLIRIWAKNILADPNAVILDTETTGLGTTDTIVEIALIDSRGNTRLDTLVHPPRAIPEAATAIHGITNEMVNKAAKWRTVANTLKLIMDDVSHCIIYNAEYDRRIVRQTHRANDMPLPQWLQNVPYSCCMKNYAVLWGDYIKYRNAYKWQSLEKAQEQLGIPPNGNAHRARSDCLATLNIIRAIAGEPPL